METNRTKVTVKELGNRTVVNFYEGLEKDLHKVGTQKECGVCGETFTIGDAEVAQGRLDYKGNPKRKLELFSGVAFIDVKLSETPINFDQYTVKERLILLGVNYVHTRFCPECNNKRGEFNDTEHTFYRPSPKREE